MKTEARIFFAWTPLHLLIAAAAAATGGPSARILIWLGSDNPEWTALASRQSLWTRMIDLSRWFSLDFWQYLRHYRRLRGDLAKVVEEIFAEHDLTEIAVATEDEYASLVFIQAYGAISGRNPWRLVSLLEDGTGLYFWTRQRQPVRHAVKLGLDAVLLRGAIPRTFGYLSGNWHLRKIYAVCPNLVPVGAGKQIVDIGKGFASLRRSLAEAAAGSVAPLPQHSAVILSERSRLTSKAQERRLIAEMVRYLRNGCGATHIYVKYHHFDPPEKKALYAEFGVREEVGSPHLPYEILHDRLRPAYLVSVSSAALFYCSLCEQPGERVAFCGGLRGLERVAELYSRSHVCVRGGTGDDAR
jgi:hypothetical protein